MREAVLLVLPAGHQPDAVRRVLAADLRAAAVATSGKLPPGAGLGLFGLAAALDRRTPFEPGDVERLRASLGRLLEVLVPGRPEPARATR